VPKRRFQVVFGFLESFERSRNPKTEHAATVEAFGYRLSVLESDADEFHIFRKRHALV